MRDGMTSLGATISPGREADLEHVLVLARERGVAVQQRAGLTFSCIGVIAPRRER